LLRAARSALVIFAIDFHLLIDGCSVPQRSVDSANFEQSSHGMNFPHHIVRLYFWSFRKSSHLKYSSWLVWSTYLISVLDLLLTPMVVFPYMMKITPSSLILKELLQANAFLLFVAPVLWSSRKNFLLSVGRKASKVQYEPHQFASQGCRLWITAGIWILSLDNVSNLSGLFWLYYITVCRSLLAFWDFREILLTHFFSWCII